MKALVIGSGGREHALVWKLAQSAQVAELYAAPGNPGMAAHAKCVDLGVNDIPGLLQFAKEKSIDLTVVGPERPLAAGIVDAFQAAGRAVFGPTRAAAQLEASKIFSKELMRARGVPTCDFEIFDNPEKAKAYARKRYDAGSAVVVKADGLAEGKGAIVTSTADEACAAIATIMEDRAFGDSGNRVLIEERLTGEEASILTICDGEAFVSLVSSQDHKRIYDDDKGPNTGGMGAYAPAPVADANVIKTVERDVIAPVLRGMIERGTPYRGVLYAGIMMVDGQPSVIEFNCRFGDPETQVVLPMMESDLFEILSAASHGRLSEVSLKNKQGAAACVVIASGGYPGSYEKGLPITGLDRANARKDTVVFHAGTAVKRVPIVGGSGTADVVCTNGGRVLGVTAWDSDLAAAIKRAYQAAGDIDFQGMHYRKDIGRKGLRRI